MASECLLDIRSIGYGLAIGMAVPNDGQCAGKLTPPLTFAELRRQAKLWIANGKLKGDGARGGAENKFKRFSAPPWITYSPWQVRPPMFVGNGSTQMPFQPLASRACVFEIK